MPRPFAACLLAASLLAARAETILPESRAGDAPNPLASPRAVPGGTISAFAGQYPQSFNYYLANNTFSASVFGSLYESLLDMDPLTAEYIPGLAAEWWISDDKRAFTFRLDEHARWSDGQPVTVRDVQWTFETIMNPAHLTGVHRVALEVFDPPVLLDGETIRFTAREVHWRNLGAVGGMHILPRHAFATLDFNKINFAFPVVSGPYRLGEIREGISARLERRDDWWGRARPRNAHVGNFQTILYRFFAERENAFESFRKGHIDIFPVYTARLWVQETRGDRMARNWIVRQKIRNRQPMGFQGFAMNMRRPPYNDLRVRLALAHLLDRERMNRTLMYNQYFLHRSYYEDLYSPEQPSPIEPIAFDKEAARRLLAEAGWRVNPQTGRLEKDGNAFTLHFLTRDPSADKFLAIYGEDLRDVGIQLVIDRKDWAAWARDMDEFNFGMTWAAWSAGLFKDPEGMWHSREAQRRGGNNITGFTDPRVDALIERQKTIFDVAQRHAICRQIDALVSADVPYVLLWNIDAVRLLYWNKFGTPPTVLSKYGGESSAFWYWWYDEDSAADLETAMRQGLHLPPVDPVVHFDKVFRSTP